MAKADSNYIVHTRPNVEVPPVPASQGYARHVSGGFPSSASAKPCAAFEETDEVASAGSATGIGREAMGRLTLVIVFDLSH